MPNLNAVKQAIPVYNICSACSKEIIDKMPRDFRRTWISSVLSCNLPLSLSTAESSMGKTLT